MAATHGHYWLERDDTEDVTVVRVKPPQLWDDETTQEIFHHIYSLVDDFKRIKLILDLAAVGHMASMALGKLIMLNRKVQAAGGRLALCGLTPVVAQVLEITHLNELFSIYPTRQEALHSFGE
jgi:anti-anti-sigma factor